MNDIPLFSVIIVKNHPDEYLKEFLDRLCAYDLDFERFEFLIVGEGKGQELLPENAKPSCQKIRFISTGYRTTFENWNEAIRQSRGEILVFTEDDVILHPDYFRTLLEEIAPLGDKALGGGKVIPVFENQKPSWMIKFFMPLLDEVNYGEEIRPFPKKSFPRGMNMVIARDYFDRFGLFEDAAHREETVRPELLFFQKLKKEGVQPLYFPNLMVWHMIPPEHLKRSYIRRQAEMNLEADLELAAKKGRAYLWKIFFKEFLKWGATLVVSFYYLITTQWEKIKPLFQYRYWRSKLIVRKLR